MSETFPNLKQIELAGKVATGLFLFMVLIKVSIACTMLVPEGGSQEQITVSLQIDTVSAAVLLAFMAFVVNLRCSHATREDLNSTMPPNWLTRSSWVITSCVGLNTVGNLASPNSLQRYGFGTLTVVLFGCCWVVSSSPVQKRSGIRIQGYEPIPNSIIGNISELDIVQIGYS